MRKDKANSKYKFKQEVMKNQIYVRYVLIALIISILGITYIVSRFVSGINDNDGRIELLQQESSTKLFNDNSSVSAEEIEKNCDSSIEQKSEQSLENSYVYICGAVNNSGVYQCDKDMRIFEVIELAGGVTPQADMTSLNLADKIQDGLKIYVPVLGEVENTNSVVGSVTAEGKTSDRININTADQSELTKLPGIGESRALDIVNYRKKNGSFKNIEDIMKVNGIKEASFEKIKDLIKV